MRPREEIRSEFVEIIPDELEEGALYISISHATALHKCLCGCGAEIVTPLSPTDWELSYNGLELPLSVSLLDPAQPGALGEALLGASDRCGAGARPTRKARSSYLGRCMDLNRAGRRVHLRRS